MGTAADLVARSGDLKRELVEYAQQPRYHQAFREALLSQDHSVMADEQKLTMFMDHFVLQHRLRNGKTVVEQFVAADQTCPRPSGSCCSAGATWSRASSRYTTAPATRS